MRRVTIVQWSVPPSMRNALVGCLVGLAADSYNRLRHVSTISFVVDEGLVWSEQ